MGKLGSIGAAVDIHQHESGAGNSIQRPPSLGHPLDQGGFTRSKVTLKADQVARMKQRTQAHPQAAGLFGGMAEEFKCMLVQDGHGEDYTTGLLASIKDEI